MGIPAESRDRLRFGAFELDLRTGELSGDGRKFYLQEQPLQVLAVLLERPGQLVTRDELKSRLWPSDTFVDFDHGLNKAVNRLREVLKDSAERPRFIETLPRRGYRFIAEVAGDDPKAPALPAATGANAGSSGIQTVSPPSPQMAVVKLGPQGITEARPQLAVPAPVVSKRKYQARAAWIFAAALLVLVVAFRFANFRRTPGPQPAMHFSIAVRVPMRDLALSPDGRFLAFIAPRPQSGGNVVWIHQVSERGAHALINTEGASYPFWSPDSSSIGFFADGKLEKIEVAGGRPQVICDAPNGRGGAWNRDGVIVFQPGRGVSISRVSATGGPVTPVAGFKEKAATSPSYQWPVFLPDGKHFLYTAVDFGRSLQGDAGAIYLAALDSPEHGRLVTSSSNAAYVPPGYLLFVRNGTLMAQRFDAGRLQMIGEAFAVANNVEYLSSVARALFSVSQNGTLVYQNSSGAAFSQLAWYDRNGKQLGAVGTPARYANPRLSPDGKRVAVDIDDPQSFNTDIWIFGPNPGATSRFTFDPAQDETPLWSHDGSRILWWSNRGGKNSFYLKASDGSGTEKPLPPAVGADLSYSSAPSDWSPDGRFLLYTDSQAGNVSHLWVLPMIGGQAHRFRESASADVEGQFSPDGRWVAYSCNESGKWQVYVAPFPGPGSEYQISTDGGQQPRWRRDGKELFFLSRDRKLMVVSVKTGSTFGFKAPAVLFQTHAREPLSAEEFFTYDVSADGQRFLMNVNAEQSNAPPVDIVLNWASDLKQ